MPNVQEAVWLWREARFDARVYPVSEVFINNLTDKVGRTVFSLGHSRCPLIIMFKLNT